MSGIDDQRMKDLADRLVAMSPEPPPFPEEVFVTQPSSSKRSPVLMFAGAAAVVLILAAIPILLLRGGGEVLPVGTTTTSTVPSTEGTEPVVTTTQATTTTEPETTTTAGEPTEVRGAVVYLVAAPENSFTGNPALVPFRTVVSVPASTSENLLSLQLVTGDLALPTGFTTMIPAEVDVIGVRVTEHLITVDMNQAFVGGAGGLLADFTMLNQLIYTAAQFGEIESVQFTVGGEPVTAFGSEGLDLSEPVGPDAFLDQMNSILITNPVEGSGDLPLAVSGIANVFEANVSYEVLDADGNIVDEGFTMAACGTGCWGWFSFEVQHQFTGEETVRVFWHSAKDGSPSDVVTIPILWDDADGWDLLAGS
ncbi:MAG: Gmad2 immunoglobulin-like domain-containing protein [Acidimicrobiia bacterium]